LYFFSFWQEVGLAILAAYDLLLSPGDEFSSHEMAILIQNFLICVEMFLASLVHSWTFGYSTYQEERMLDLMLENEAAGTGDELLIHPDMMNFEDTEDDVTL